MKIILKHLPSMQGGKLFAWAKNVSLFLIISMLTACVIDSNMILETKDIQFFNVKQIDGSPVVIEISGLVFHSSLGIEKIKTATSDHALQVLVYLAPATRRHSGNLDYRLTIPESINRVVFGSDKTVIWERK